MTTYGIKTMKCAICGEQVVHRMSVNMYSRAEFDDVSECHQCGYVGFDLSLPCEFQIEKLQALYNEVETLHEWPSGPDRNAKKFAKFGNFLAATGEHSEAAQQFLYAVAVFDDIDDPLKALIWLTRANYQFEICLKNEFSVLSFCMHVYTLRRTGQMRRVLDTVVPANHRARLTLEFLAYQKILAANNFRGIGDFSNRAALVDEQEFEKAYAMELYSVMIQDIAENKRKQLIDDDLTPF